MPMVQCRVCGYEDTRDYMQRCADCGRLHCEDCRGWVEGFGMCDNGHCESCCCCSDAEHGSVHSYDYRPHLLFKGDTAQTMMGVELEVYGLADQIVDAVHLVDAHEDHLYMKHDGSISGVEIVTHPMTLEYARQYPFSKLLKNLRLSGSSVYDNYGLHIHVARDAFRKKSYRTHKQQSDAHQMMWLLFMYRNSEQLEKLARRSSQEWASFRKPRKGVLKEQAKGDRNLTPRYTAVNCQNRETFELRFFKATLDEQEFYAALEFADASVKYTSNLSAVDVLKGRALGWDQFTDWVLKHNYTHLYREILKQS
jgi:hypothetical protein